MSQITTVPPNVSNAGYTFNYALWTAGTVVTLVNVPWDADYRNLFKSMNQGELDAWINAQSNRLVVSQLQHNRLNQPIKIDAPFERVVGYNFVRATNPAQPVSGSLPSTYYYFIKNVQYGAPNTTILNLQLDVWSTFNHTVSFGRCYVERGHVGIANSRQQEQNGRNYLTVPEGMNLGNEMEVAHSWKHQVASARGAAPGLGYSVMVTASQDLEAIAQAGTAEDARIVTAKGSKLENLPNGGAVYYFRAATFLHMFLAANAAKSWVTQSITSITAIPALDEINAPKTEISLEGVPADGVFVAAGGTIPQTSHQLAADWTSELGLSSRYSHLHKFKTYPYSAIELTSYSGQPLIMKPESMPARSIDVTAIYHLNPGSGRVTFVPGGYNRGIGANSESDQFGATFDGGEWLDFATSIANFPQFSTVNNSFSSFMAANKNQIGFQFDSASWAQQRAMQSANTAFDQASSGINTTNELNASGMARTSATAAQANVTGAMQGGVSMLQQGVGAGMSAPRGGAGAVIGGVSAVGGTFANTVIQQNQNTAQASIENAAAQRATTAQVGNQGVIQDTNMALAKSVSAGDYANDIAGVQARVEDAKMLQPTTSGQIGGDAFNLATTGWIIFAKLKRLHGVAMAEIGEYWLRYGYRINRWVTPPASLLVCENFTYWQMKDAMVFSDACPEEYRQTIRGIFEVGTTVYADPDHIGTIDPANNTPLGGISY